MKNIKLSEQAIITKFIGPTNTKGARVKARCAAGSLVSSWHSEYNVPLNHELAAMKLAHKLQWTKRKNFTLLGAGLPDGTGFAFICVSGTGAK